MLEGFNKCGGDTAGQKNFIQAFEDLTNRQILGSEERRSNWRVCTAEDMAGHTIIADQPMPNNHVRKFVGKFEALCALCLSDDIERQAKWMEVIEIWKELITLAGQKEDLSDDEIDTFSNLCDRFFSKWVGLKGRDGITNYIHMLGAGHFTYYLRKWRNLYRFSQQGWEALNAQIKAFFFRRTQRGGHGGRQGQRNSKVKPIGLWLQRKLFFLSGDYKKCKFDRPRQL